MCRTAFLWTPGQSREDPGEVHVLLPSRGSTPWEQLFRR